MALQSFEILEYRYLISRQSKNDLSRLILIIFKRKFEHKQVFKPCKLVWEESSFSTVPHSILRGLRA